jgi:hypothetical protein
MLKEVVDLLLIRSKFSTWLPSAGGRECLISYPSKFLCCGRMQVMTRLMEFHKNWPHGTGHNLHTPAHTPKHVGV